MKSVILLLSLILAPGCALADDFQQMVLKNNLDGIASELDNAADIDARGTNGKTALMIVAKVGDHYLDQRLRGDAAV